MGEGYFAKENCFLKNVAPDFGHNSGFCKTGENVLSFERRSGLTDLILIWFCCHNTICEIHEQLDNITSKKTPLPPPFLKKGIKADIEGTTGEKPRKQTNKKEGS